MGYKAETVTAKEVQDLRLPTYDYRKTHIKTPKKLLQGLDAFAYGLAGKLRSEKKELLTLEEQANRITYNAKELFTISDRRLKEKLKDAAIKFRRQGKDCDEVLPDALSAMCAVMERTIGLKPYPVQVMGAIALHKGRLAEMATGEGKSLTACLPAALAGWTGRPCHIVTVNDYLANRDAVEMEAFYTYCGVSVGSVTSVMDNQTRQNNYNSGVVYTTSKELLADFLKDRIKLGAYHNHSRRLIKSLMRRRLRSIEDLVLRGLDTAIVDEADSVLIDEAVTPLIISSPQDNKELVEAVETAKIFADNFYIGDDYTAEAKYHEIRITKRGYTKLEAVSDTLTGIWRGAARKEELVTQALTAKEFYHKDKQYLIKDGKIIIVDEFTGRLMPGRSWSYGLHQAIEAKEELEITNPSQTLARLSFQRFFRLFRKLSGMTGTAKEAAGEFRHIYGLNVISIPTNRPCIREVYPDAVFSNAEKKWNAVVEEIIRIHSTDRPLLVGTRSVEASESLASMLIKKGLDFNLLNASRYAEEARIVAEAGQGGKITIATNMAGRGTDIKLGKGIPEIGGLHVIATERHESGRIDRQLFGRCARQGDPGSSQAFISIDDELFRKFIPEPVKKRLAQAIEKDTYKAKEAAKRTLFFAQYISQRFAFRQRKSVLRMDTWIEDALTFTGSGISF